MNPPRLSRCLFRAAVVLTLIATFSGMPPHRITASAGPPPGSVEASFRNFCGAVNLISTADSKKLGVGWLRILFDWRAIEPHKGDWQWQHTDAAIEQVHRSGMEMLPDIAFTPGWAAMPAHPGFQPFNGPPAKVADWEDFVEHVVSRYSAPPYNLRYFQIWNEPGGPFFQGTDQQFADLVHIPAAKIIRTHHGMVVFGGLADVVNLQRFSALMNYHDLWRWTDIVDVHYKGFAEFQQFYLAWVANGKCRGMWQTEVGNTAEPGFLDSLYCRTLHWTVQVGWRDPDEFKLFWYAGQGPNDICLINVSKPPDQRVTGNGMQLAALNQVLGEGSLSNFTEFSTVPQAGPPGAGWALGYRVGTRRVVINFLADRGFFQAHASALVSVTMPRPSRVQLMSGVGKTWDLPVQYSAGRVQVEVPFHSGFLDCPACKNVAGFLVLDQ
ncbi:MAG TPA: hypothetical protein VMP68_31570 [Candidatus Eisenbacteria bacterium]|nr:hypothetical protein [Candidatus Eisenbacteria bacterium]